MKNQIKLSAILLLGLLFFACSDDEPSSSCTDGILNGSEIGIDCGGSDCSPCPTCFDGTLNGDETGVDCGGDCDPCYGLGLPGQAGGIIFYDKGAVTDGRQYLEVAESDFANNGCYSSIQYSSNLDTDNNIGTGLENTIVLANAMNVETMYSLAIEHIENGKSDWFLPSKDELTLIFENKMIIPNLSNDSGECLAYWDSTLGQLPNGNWLPEIMDIVSGDFYFPNPSHRFRLIRRF